MPSLRPRITPSFVVALLALVLASGGVGYAAGQITSPQIKDNTIRSRDVRDGSLTGADVRPGSLPRNRVSRACPQGQYALFGGCVNRFATGPTSQQAAVDDCNRRNGRLPTVGELRWIATHDQFVWANGNPNNYEFSSDWTVEFPYTPLGLDATGFGIANASAQMFWHRCVITY